MNANCDMLSTGNIRTANIMPQSFWCVADMSEILCVCVLVCHGVGLTNKWCGCFFVIGGRHRLIRMHLIIHYVEKHNGDHLNC